MNYDKIYSSIIQNRKNIPITGYTEKHHVVPRCLGGTNDPENLISLTAREHFVCHQLLVKIYPDNHKLKYAAFMMTVKSSNQKREFITSKKYNLIKQKMSLACRERLSNPINHPMFGKKHSKYTKEKMSIKAKSKVISLETREKISKAQIGKTISIEHKAKLTTKGRKRPLEEILKINEIKNKNMVIRHKKCSVVVALIAIFHNKVFSYKRSIEHQEKLNSSYKTKPKKICPYCNLEMDFRNYGKYHGDKCKFK